MPLLILLTFLLLPDQLLAGTDLKVITSIRPLQLITDEIMAGAGQSTLLLNSDQSPHHFQLKPSQLKTISKADLIIWVSNEFETGLSKFQTILPTQTEQLELTSDLPLDNLIMTDHSIDGHIWLSPENVLHIAQLISQKLSRLDQDNSQLYLMNTLNLVNKVSSWKHEAQQKMREIKPRYILDHQFMAYFERSFGLQNMGTLRDDHDHGSSIKQLSNLHNQLKINPPECLLVSSLPLSRQVRQISNQYQLQTIVINTLDAENKYETIIDLLELIVKNLANCE